jgi:hypothetical protein
MAEKEPNFFFRFAFVITLVLIIIIFVISIIVASTLTRGHYNKYVRPQPKNYHQTPDVEYTFDYQNLTDLGDFSKSNATINPKWESRCQLIGKNRLALNNTKRINKTAAFPNSFLYDEDYSRENFELYSFEGTESEITEAQMLDVNLYFPTSTTTIQRLHGITTTSLSAYYNKNETSEGDNGAPIFSSVKASQDKENILQFQSADDPKQVDSVTGATLDYVSTYSVTISVEDSIVIIPEKALNQNVFFVKNNTNGGKFANRNYYNINMYQEQVQNPFTNTSISTTDQMPGENFMYFHSGCKEQRLKLSATGTTPDMNIYYNTATDSIQDQYIIARLVLQDVERGSFGDFKTGSAGQYYYILSTSDLTFDVGLRDYISLYPFQNDVIYNNADSAFNVLPLMYFYNFATAQTTSSAYFYNVISSSAKNSDTYKNYSPRIMYFYPFDTEKEVALYVNSQLMFMSAGAENFVMFRDSTQNINRAFPFSSIAIYKNGTKFLIRLILSVTAYTTDDFFN